MSPVPLPRPPPRPPPCSLLAVLARTGSHSSDSPPPLSGRDQVISNPRQTSQPWPHHYFHCNAALPLSSPQQAAQKHLGDISLYVDSAICKCPPHRRIVSCSMSWAGTSITTWATRYAVTAKNASYFWTIFRSPKSLSEHWSTSTSCSCARAGHHRRFPISRTSCLTRVICSTFREAACCSPLADLPHHHAASR